MGIAPISDSKTSDFDHTLAVQVDVPAGQISMDNT